IFYLNILSVHKIACPEKEYNQVAERISFHIVIIYQVLCFCEIFYIKCKLFCIKKCLVNEWLKIILL
ncbi:hypothetical protein, partial [Enterobacter hormaechei]|uniref:hypothetical protein n=1 Tax=Enterobacter hormaechei TaxID=158836 RepID=UPI0022F11B62